MRRLQVPRCRLVLQDNNIILDLWNALTAHQPRPLTWVSWDGGGACPSYGNLLSTANFCPHIREQNIYPHAQCLLTLHFEVKKRSERWAKPTFTHYVVDLKSEKVCLGLEKKAQRAECLSYRWGSWLKSQLYVDFHSCSWIGFCLKNEQLKMVRAILQRNRLPLLSSTLHLSWSPQSEMNTHTRLHAH